MQEDKQLAQFFQRRKPVINEKLKRCREFKNNNSTISYRENTPKQELVLQHVIQFKKQFQQHIGQNRELFLYPKNQCDVYKFICTTIRPSKLGFLQLYNYEDCAQRLCSFIQYQELDPPDEFPKCIPSPANVAHWQKGDCFDLSILLTSLLIGVGYDAYCVYGIAPKEITSKNQALTQCLYLQSMRQKDQFGKATTQNAIDNNIFQKRVTESSFDKAVVEKELKQKSELAAKALTIDDDEPDQLTPDLFLGKRIHCWVLLKKGKRGVTQDLFIEPSTGRIYDIKHSPYLLVDAIFNNTNFFIHMQPRHKVDEIKFQLYETITWEYVMLHDELFRTANDEDAHDLDNENLVKMSDEEEKLKYLAQTLDMPPPWSPKIQIDREMFSLGTPLGQTTSFFIKCKIEKYANYSQADGLVLKYTLYDDFKKLRTKEIGYIYKHRSDKLQRKYRYPFEFKTVQYYGPGKLPHWKQVTEVDRRMRIIDYYPNRNHDGLIRRIQKIGQKTTQIYTNRDDYISSRTLSFVPDSSNRINTAKNYFYEDNHVKKVCVTKLTQQYQKRPNVAAREQIARMIVDFQKERVTVYYHMEEGEIEPLRKEYPRDKILGYGKIEAGEKKGDDLLMQQEHQTLHSKEKECYQILRNEEGFILEEYKQMRNGALFIEKTLHDKARDKFKDYKNTVEEETAEQDANDYLKPYLVKRGLPTNERINELALATDIKGEVMKKYKERIIARAKIIQERLQKQQDYLKQLEDQYQKKQEEKNQAELSQVKFKINILESRSSRFEALAMQKFQEMDSRITNDPRLAVLKEKK